MAHPVTPPGWQRAGFSSSTCARLVGGRAQRTGAPVLAGPVDGWADAGYASPDCERFAPTGQG